MSVTCPNCQKPVEGAILKVEADAERDRKVAAAQAAAEQASAATRAEAERYKSAAEQVAAELVREREASAASQRAVRTAQVEAAGLSPEYLPVLEMVYGTLPERDRPEFKKAIGPDGVLRNHTLTRPYFAAPAAPVVPVAPAALAAPAAPAVPANGTQPPTAPAVPDLATAVAEVLSRMGVPAAQPANGLPRIAPAQPPAASAKLTPAQVQEKLTEARKTMKPDEYKAFMANMQKEYA